jgi:hypothetical protein
MANLKNSTNTTSSAMLPNYLSPLIEPYSYLPSNKEISNDAYFAERALTMSRGAKVLVDILRMDVVERDAGRNPVLDVGSIDALAGFLSESMHLLAGLAEQRLDAFNCGKA